MGTARMRPTLPSALTAATAVVALVVAAGAVSAPSAQAACANEAKAVDQASAAELRTAVVCLTNEARVARGLGPLAAEGRLEAAAQAHATDMQAKGYFAHVSSTGSGPGDRITAAGYAWSSYGENIARGQRTPFDVVEAWLRSSGHCTNILGGFTEIGVGITTASHWVQDFAVPSGAGAQAGGGACPASLNRAAVELPAIPAAPVTGPGATGAIRPVLGTVTPRPGQRRRLRVAVICPPGRTTCTGRVRIRLGRKGAVLGRTSFTVASGSVRTITVRLTRKGERRLRRADRRKVLVQLVSPGVPSSSVGAELTRAR